MQYKYLAQFARENINPGLFYRSVKRWRDQYAIIFSDSKYLQVSLMQQDPLCFFTDKDIIEWGAAPELAMMDQHLHRARLESISISKTDRIIYLELSKPDPFKGRQFLNLILELIPQFGNIILTRKENHKQIIIDCARKISLAENKQRQLLPAVEYEPPPAGFINEIGEIGFPVRFDDKMKVIENTEDGYHNCNDLLENIYYQGWLKKLSDQNLKNQKQKLKRELKKKQRKLEKLEAELSDAEKETGWLQMGELLKANQHLLKPGMEKIKVINYYDSSMSEVEINLKAEKSVQWNISEYFKKYRKAKTGKQKISEQIELTGEDILKLERQISDLETMDLLLPGQIIQPVTGRNSTLENISRIPVNEDWELMIGRNSTENDLLTTRIANPDDWWFHTRIFKGTHVVLRNPKKKELPDHLLELGCRIAAYYSKAAKSENVPVDYTQIRYVRKPRGSAPGFVTYTHQKTLYVNPLSLRQAREIVAQWQS